MTNDKQVEVWTSDFWKLVESSPDSIRNSEYTMIRLEGYLMVKRSLQPIELPENYYSPDNFDVHGAAVEAFDSAIDDCKRSITAAGYSYKVK